MADYKVECHRKGNVLVSAMYLKAEVALLIHEQRFCTVAQNLYPMQSRQNLRLHEIRDVFNSK